MKTAREINPSVTEEIEMLRRKAFSALVKTKAAQPSKWTDSANTALVCLVDP